MSHDARHCRSNSTSPAVQCMAWSDKRLLTLPRSGPYVWQWLKRPPAFEEPASARAAEQDGGTATTSALYHPPGSMGQGAMGPSWSELCWLPGPVPWKKASNAVLARRTEDSGKVYPPYSVLKDFGPDLTMAPSQLARTSRAAVDTAAQAAHAPKRSKGQSLRALYVRGAVTCGECFKPRAVYGATSTSTLQKASHLAKYISGWYSSSSRRSTLL